MSKSAVMEVTTVSAWLVPVGSTIEDICVVCRGVETARLVRKADVMAYDHLVESGGDVVKARLEGLVYSRNKAYVLADGDVVSNFLLT
jgi:ribosome-binding ATPase YchF (GTP1/OBG family)